MRRLLSAAWASSAESPAAPSTAPSSAASAAPPNAPSTGPAPAPRTLPAPLDPFSYDAGALLDLDLAHDLEGFLLVPECDPRAGGVGGGVRAGFHGVPMLVATAPGACLSLDFEGRAVGVWVAAGPDAGRLEYRVDGGPWRERELFTPWSGGLHLPWVHVLEAELDRARHVLDLRVAPGRHGRSRGHAARIAHFVVNR